MHYKNTFCLRLFLFIALVMAISMIAAAKDGSDLPNQAQTPGAKVPGVDVSLEQVSGGKVLTAKTDETGSFTFSDVAPGSYKLRIGCAGTGGAGVQRCYAEFRIEITDNSTGVIKGAIRMEGR